MSSSTYDVAIIGGGPAGSTAAALLAGAGRRVIVFEREKFPRFHIGESLLPFSMKAFTRLGLHEKFLHAGFLKKFGGEIFGACSDQGTKFYFKDGYRSKTDHAYQVTRGDFTRYYWIMPPNAARKFANRFQLIVFSSHRITSNWRSKATVHLSPFGRVTSSTPAGARRFSADTSKSKRLMIIFRSYPSSRTTTVSGAPR